MSKELLLVVDMQNDFIDGDLGTKEAQDVVQRVASKISNWGGDIICTLDTHGKDYMKTKEGRALPIPHCIEGTNGHKLNEDVREALFHNAATACNMLQKRTFGSTALPELIRGSGIDYIEIVGVCTDICVISNAILLRAHYPEIEIVVDSSCCAGTSPESHEAALNTMRMCQITVK